MATITSAGVGSGLDINGIVSKLVAAERATRLTPLVARESTLTSKLSLYGQIKSSFTDLETSTRSLLSAFQTYLNEFNNFNGVTITNNGNGTSTVFTPGNGQAPTIQEKTTNNSNPSVIGLNADPAYGVYNYSVTRLAQAQTYEINASSLTENFGGGTLRIEFGDGQGDFDGTTLNANAARTVDLNLGANATTNDVVSAINGANLGLTASFDATLQKITVRGQSGQENAFRFTVADEPNQNPVLGPSTGPNDGNTNNNVGFSRLVNGTYTTQAFNFQGDVDGVSFSQSNNRVVQGGLDFNVLNLGSGTITVADQTVANPNYTADRTETRPTQADDPEPGVTKKVGVTTTGVTSSIDEFISKYNLLVGKLKQGQKKGDRLDVDTMPANLERRLLTIMNRVYNGTESKTDLGFSIAKDGTLSLDKDKARKLLEQDPDAFKRIFTDGLGKDIAAFSKQVNSEGGSLDAKSDQLNAVIKSLQRKQEVETDRVGRLEIRYMKQFTALDSLLAELQASSSFLANSLASLPSPSRR